MASLGPADIINDQAAMWAVDAIYGELTPERRADLNAWLAADRRHRGAYLHARASIIAMEKAVIAVHPSGQADRDTDAPTSVHERWPRWAGAITAGGMALAASVAAIFMVGAPATPPEPSAAATAGQVMNLEDGSVATLKPGARIAFAEIDGVRTVTLMSGEARFKVAHDKAHPFVVRSGGVYAQATGTVYSVSRLGETGGAVHVMEGGVLVWARDGRDQAILVHPGETVTLDLGAMPPAKAASPPPPPALAQIALDNVTIEAAAARFNRVNSTKIVVTDQAIGATAIDGIFRANDPERFAEAAAAVAGGHVTREAGRIVIKPEALPAETR